MFRMESLDYESKSFITKKKKHINLIESLDYKFK